MSRNRWQGAPCARAGKPGVPADSHRHVHFADHPLRPRKHAHAGVRPCRHERIANRRPARLHPEMAAAIPTGQEPAPMKNRRDFLKLGALAALGAYIPGCRKADKPHLEAFTGPLDPLRAYPYRSWEDLYRKQWTWDKVVRSAHSANCTGSCRWNVY